MFSLVIVDDKKSIRDGLINYIDWNSLGFTIVGDFPSAKDAIKFMESECVDVLLTDIVMPEKNGLELIKDVKLINPDIKVMILSAYENFEYAQEAMRLGAFNYFTKPVFSTDLIQQFEKLRVILEKESILRAEKIEFRNFTKEQFLNNLVHNYFNAINVIQKKAVELNINLLNGEFCVVRLLFDKINYLSNDLEEATMPSLKSTLYRNLEEFLSPLGRAYIFTSSLNEVTIIFYANRFDQLEMNMLQLNESIQHSLKLSNIIGIGKKYDSILYVRNSYIEAGKALEYRVIKKKMPVLLFDDIAVFFKGKSLITAKTEETILTHLSLHQENELKKYILSIINDNFKTDYSNDNTSIIYDACIEILIIVNKFLASNVVDKKSIEQNDYFSIKTLLQKQKFEEINYFLDEYLSHCFTIIRNYQEESSGLIIETTKKYILDHYNEDITLDKLSEVVYVNPSYLSRLFKEKTGENFLEYLTRIRIENAKMLLENLSLRIYDITQMVGYESRTYFTKIFKEITGLSPKEYRNSLS